MRLLFEGANQRTSTHLNNRIAQIKIFVENWSDDIVKVLARPRELCKRGNVWCWMIPPLELNLIEYHIQEFAG